MTRAFGTSAALLVTAAGGDFILTGAPGFLFFLILAVGTAAGLFASGLYIFETLRHRRPAGADRRATLPDDVRIQARNELVRRQLLTHAVVLEGLARDTERVVGNIEAALEDLTSDNLGGKEG